MTADRPHLQPGPDHPITVERSGERVTATVGPVVVAASERALVLRESSYPAVYYIPVDDVTPGLLRPSGEHTYCPYKGEASYYDLVGVGDDAELAGAVWYYPTPFPAVSEIAGHVAFYPDRVTVTAGGGAPDGSSGGL